MSCVVVGCIYHPRSMATKALKKPETRVGAKSTAKKAPSKSSAEAKKEIVHVGYRLNLEAKNIEELAPFLGSLKDASRNEIYTAVLHKSQHHGQGEMATWYTQRKEKKLMAYIRNLYVDEKQGIVVAHATIEAEHLYVTLVHSKMQIPLHTLKKKVSNGDFGPKIEVPRIAVTCGVYCTF